MSDSIAVKVSNNGDRMYYSLVEKNSESGIRYNERLLVLVEEKYLGYVTDFNSKNLASSCVAKKIRKKVALKDIRRVSAKDRSLTILINMLEDDKRKSVKWLFRISSPKIATEWAELLMKQGSPFPSRTPTEHKNNEEEQSPLKPDTKVESNPTIREIVQQQQLQRNNSTKNQIGSPDERREQDRDSHKPYSFQAEQDRMMSESNNFSPIKSESPSISLRILQTPVEETLSSKLQKQVDFKLIEDELSDYKAKKLNKKIHKEPNFRQLSSIIEQKRDLHSSNFCNYFREPAAILNDDRYQDFYHLCRLLVEEFSMHRDELVDPDWIEAIRHSNGLNATIIETDLKQIPGDNQVCDEGLLKSILNRFKNMDYLWKLISQDSILCEIFLIPMNCVIEYQGITCYFVADFEPTQSNKSGNFDVDYSQYFQRLSEISMISKLALEKQENVKFTPYGRNKFVISEVNEYLPKISPLSTQMRPELFHSLVLEGDIEEPYLVQKGKKEEDQQARLFRQPIENAIGVLSRNFNKLQEYIVHPSEFSTLLHVYGLNINMLSRIYAQVSHTFVREILKTEAAVRSFKMIYRKKMQETVGEKNLEQRNKLYGRITKSMLNVFLGAAEQSDTMWKIVTLHSQIYFQMAVSKEEVNKGYLVMALEHHLGVKIGTLQKSCNKIFHIQSFVNSVQFKMKTKVCQLYWADAIHDLSTVQAANELITVFRLGERNFPFHIFQDKKTYEVLIDVLSLHYGPNSTLSHLGIYKTLEESAELTLLYHRRKITEIKWLIKEGRVNMQEVEARLEELQAPLRFYFGTNHPFFIEVCDILIASQEQSGNYEQAYEHCKTSLANTLQLCGGNNMHIKLASNNYQMGQCLQLWGKLDEAMAQFQKAKNILQFNSLTNSREYALVLLKLSHLYLAKLKDQECFKLLLNCYEILFNSDDEELNIEELVETVQLMSRCEAEIPLKLETLFNSSTALLKDCIHNGQSSKQSLISVLKIVLECFYIQNGRQIDLLYVQFLQSLSDQAMLAAHQAQREQGIEVIKQFILNDRLFETLDNFWNKTRACIQKKGKIRQVNSRELDDFERLNRSLMIVLGEGFMLGMVESSHK